MFKPVKAVIATARVHLQMPSERKLPLESMRVILHQILEEKHAEAILVNKDFYTHEADLTLTYNSGVRGFEYSASLAGANKIGFDVVKLLFQDLTADPATDSWSVPNRVKLSMFAEQSQMGLTVFTLIGNDWQGIHPPIVKFNATQEWVEDQRWKAYVRLFPSDVLDYDDTVPFPEEYTSLLEYALADRCLPLIKDGSPEFEAFYMKQAPKLATQVAMQSMKFTDWLSREIENEVIVAQPYHYVKNNPLRTPLKRFKVEE